MRRTLLLVDDDDDLRESIAEQFIIQEEFSVEQAANGTDGLALAKNGRHDLIILDVNMPDMDGRDLTKLMRKHGVRAPIILLTALEGDADAILGLESGANDYVNKPVRFGVLHARVRAHLRQHENTDDATFEIGPYTFKPSAKMMVDESAGAKVRLTDKETAIIKFLIKAGGRPVARDTLLDEVWGYNAGVTTHTLETHVYRLRQKIETDPSNASLLITEAGGYRIAFDFLS
ncbi:MAG: response regulator transcription factor [Pseudomonadota bacterium]